MILFLRDIIRDLIEEWIRRLFTRYHPCKGATSRRGEGLSSKVDPPKGPDAISSTDNAIRQRARVPGTR